MSWTLASGLAQARVVTGECREPFEAEGGELRGSLYGRATCAETSDRSDVLSVQPNSRLDPTIIEVAIEGGSRVDLCYRGSLSGELQLTVEQIDDGGAQVLLTDRVSGPDWVSRELTIPATVLLRIVVAQGVFHRVNNANQASFTGEAATTTLEMSMTGDGRLIALDPDITGSTPTQQPDASVHAIEARDGYDTIFYDGQARFSFGTKATGDGTHRLVSELGGTMYSIEGPSNEIMHADGTWDDELLRILDANIEMCRASGLVYKTMSFEAHSNPYLPLWAMDQHDLYQELQDESGNNIRPRHRRVGHYACLLKPKTQEIHLSLIRAMARRYRDQPMMYTVMTEPQLTEWQCECRSCLSSWHDWLRQRFDDDFAGLSAYVGGTKASGFDRLPLPRMTGEAEGYGYSGRAHYLRLRFALDAYIDYIDAIGVAIKDEDPDAMLCQRGTVWPGALAVARGARTDYSYALAHLVGELDNSYGVGRKPWYGIHGHLGAMPWPKMGSIAKSASRAIRNTVLSEDEWRTSIFTLLANGVCGAEFQPLLDAWTWGKGASLYDADYRPTRQGKRARDAIAEAQALAPRLLHYERTTTIAMLHNEIGRDAVGHPRLTAAKAGLRGMLRELGYQVDALTDIDVENGRLDHYQVLFLVGDLAIAPDVQQRIGRFAAAGGTVIAGFEPIAGGLPGCNSYDFDGAQIDSAAEHSFRADRADDHLGELLGVRQAVGWDGTDLVELTETGNGLDPGTTFHLPPVGSERQPTTGRLTANAEAEIVAWFVDDDGEQLSPAVLTNRVGEGRAITLGFCPGLIAADTFHDEVYRVVETLLNQSGVPRGSYAMTDVVTVGYGATESRPWRVEVGTWRDDEGRPTVIMVNHDHDLLNEGWLRHPVNNGIHPVFGGRNLLIPRSDPAGPAAETRVRYRLGAADACALTALFGIRTDQEVQIEVHQTQGELAILLRASVGEASVVLVPYASDIFAVVAVDGDVQNHTARSDGTIELNVAGGTNSSVLLTTEGISR